MNFLRSFVASLLCQAIIVLALSQGIVADDLASCTDFAKGDFGPETLTADENCQIACQVAEGLPVGRYTSEDGYITCKCLKIEEDGSASQTRDLCADGTPSGAGRVATGLGVTAAVAMLVAISCF
jgi:hypothetical protein